MGGVEGSSRAPNSQHQRRSGPPKIPALDRERRYNARPSSNGKGRKR
jgi:hypothetical protein